ncbi:MAG: DUF1667 domain-containing protein [Clostridia bacterium]|nr:DUF1667 domain-containing protein [Clostridia bacterium]
MEKQMICIVCPIGCHIEVKKVEDQVVVTGNQCNRGAVYGKEELIAPKRVLPTTVKFEGGLHERLPVKTSAPVLKSLLFELMAYLNKITVKGPVKMGDVVVKNILDTGVDMIATRDM